MMRLIFLSLIIFQQSLYSQIGIKTSNPKAILHVDGNADNPLSGNPSATEELNDMVVTSSGQMGVGTITPDKSSILHLKSSNKGVLLPKVNLQSKNDDKTIVQPATGLLVYNENPTLYGGSGLYYNYGIPTAPEWIKLTTTMNIPEDTYFLSNLQTFEPSKKKDLVYSYNQLVNNCDQIYPEKCYPSPTIPTESSYEIKFDKKKNTSDKYAVLYFEYSFNVNTVDSRLIKQGNWLTYDIVFKINGSIVSTYSDLVIDFPQNSGGLKNLNKLFTINLSNMTLNSQNNTIDIIFKPKSSVFKANRGTDPGNYSGNEKDFLFIKMKDASFQFFEK